MKQRKLHRYSMLSTLLFLSIILPLITIKFQKIPYDEYWKNTASDTVLNTQTTTTITTTSPTSFVPKKRKRLKIIHVMNPYAIQVKNDDDNNNNNGSNNNNDNSSDNSRYNYTYMSPFHQWSSIKSIERALQYIRQRSTSTTKEQLDVDVDVNVEVDFVCAMFESDAHHLRHENLPCRTAILNRSTRTEYNNFMPHPIQELPFIQDLIDVAVADYYQYRNGNGNDDNDIDDGDGDGDDFFVMVTNSDIGLTKNFYSELIPKLKNREAISINRLTIPITENINKTKIAYATTVTATTASTDNINNSSSNNNSDVNYESANSTVSSTSDALSTPLLTEIDDNLRHGEKHGGFDCFVIHSSVLKRIRFGDLFAGFPPWGRIFHLTLQKMATNYKNYKSSQHNTFHIGLDRSNWHVTTREPKTEMSGKEKNDNNRRKELVKKCPGESSGFHPYVSLNMANCGILWSRTTPTPSLFNNNNNNSIGIGSNITSNKRITTNTTTNNNGTIITETITYMNIPTFVQSGYEDLYIHKNNDSSAFKKVDVE